MKNNIDNIKGYQYKLKNSLLKERDMFGGYEAWFEKLEPFRKQLEKYVWYDMYHRVAPMNGRVALDNGHYIDHHAAGYFAPLNFKRIGFEGEKRTPAQQLSYLNKYLKDHGIRFIYVALPCKEAVYPELLMEESVVSQCDVGGKLIPQWRKMLLELMDENVEVIDLYDDFLKEKKESELFSYDHFVSCMGAELISRKVAEYLKNTTIWNQENNIQLTQNLQYEWNGPTTQNFAEGTYFMKQKQLAYVVKMQSDKFPQPYIGIEDEFRGKSEISVFGNCNLGVYLYDGTGIHSNLAYHLQYPVRYAGRYLPFSGAAGERVASMPKSMLKNNKILIEIGFPSGSFVRAPFEYESLWSLKTMNPYVFE